MPECNHCGESFDDEDAYARHLRDNHSEDLSRIEQQAVDKLRKESGSGVSVIAIAAVALFGIVLAGVFYFIFVGGGDGVSGDGVQNVGADHYHAAVSMAVNGSQVDFSQQKYQGQDRAVHFEGDSRLHIHAQQATLGYFMQTVGMGVSENSLTYEGESYVDGRNASIRVRANGAPVRSLPDYVIREGDRIQINVTERS
jgi:hypothetical protein